MGSIEEYEFSAPPEIVSADGLLFDFDGRFCYSLPAIQGLEQFQADVAT